jgi:hypothetical protein
MIPAYIDYQSTQDAVSSLEQHTANKRHFGYLMKSDELLKPAYFGVEMLEHNPNYLTKEKMLAYLQIDDRDVMAHIKRRVIVLLPQTEFVKVMDAWIEHGVERNMKNPNKVAHPAIMRAQRIIQYLPIEATILAKELAVREAVAASIYAYQLREENSDIRTRLTDFEPVMDAVKGLLETDKKTKGVEKASWVMAEESLMVLGLTMQFNAILGWTVDELEHLLDEITPSTGGCGSFQVEPLVRTPYDPLSVYCEARRDVNAASRLTPESLRLFIAEHRHNSSPASAMQLEHITHDMLRHEPRPFRASSEAEAYGRMIADIQVAARHDHVPANSSLQLDADQKRPTKP